MQKKRLGCLSPTGLLAGALTLLIITALGATRGGRMFSPGALNAQAGVQALGGVYSHAETGGRCGACHARPWETQDMSAHCLACHTDLTGDPKNFHTVMIAQSQSAACYSCHTDHRGSSASLTRMDTQNFPHLAVGFSLQAHRKTSTGTPFTCKDCHTEDLSRFNPTVCADCHTGIDAAYMQTHLQAFGADCLACHDGVDRYGSAFDHSRLTFPLAGEHASLACVACHAGAHTPQDLQLTKTDCAACHAKDDAHQGSFGLNCADCHTPDDWENASFDHSKAAFPLNGKHASVACNQCHQKNQFKGTPADCAACHTKDDAHRGSLGQDCGACHTPDDWKKASFDHSKAAFPLNGKHATVACDQCHQKDQFKGTPADCAACHTKDDAHQGSLGQDCGACHIPDDWKKASFDHSKAAFQLDGKHAGVACDQCHMANQFKGTPADCAACHAKDDAHQGSFGQNCAECHTAVGWLPASYDRPHLFPINHGERGNSTCKTCHPDSLLTYTCYGCHEHNPTEIAAKHLEERISNFDNCVECHANGRERGGGD